MSHWGYMAESGLHAGEPAAPAGKKDRSQKEAVPTTVLLVSGPASGGLRRHLQLLCDHLPARGVVLELAAPASLRLQGQVPVFALDIGDRPRPRSDLGALMQLLRRVRQVRPAIIHAHGVKAALLSLVAARLIPRKKRPRLVVTFHNLWNGGPLTPVLQRLLPGADAVIGVSQAVLAALREQGIRGRRTYTIPNGIDATRMKVRDVTEAPPGTITAAFLGRLTEEKGVRVLLEATRILSEETSLRWVVAGDGPLRAEVESAAVDDTLRLRYAGEVADPGPLYTTSELVVIPSFSEGQSLVALEAMAAGLPVIATAVGGLPEVVVAGETGIIIPPGNPEALATAVRHLLRDADRRAELGTAGRARVEREFGLGRMIEDTLAVYGMVTATRQR